VPVRVTFQSRSIPGRRQKKKKKTYSLRRPIHGAGYGSLGNALEKLCKPPHLPMIMEKGAIIML
jgi:hypothetical protein